MVTVRKALFVLSMVYLAGAIWICRFLFLMVTSMADMDPTMVQLRQGIFELGACGGCFVTFGLWKVVESAREMVREKRSASRAVTRSCDT